MCCNIAEGCIVLIICRVHRVKDKIRGRSLNSIRLLISGASKCKSPNTDRYYYIEGGGDRGRRSGGRGKRDSKDSRPKHQHLIIHIIYCSIFLSSSIPSSNTSSDCSSSSSALKAVVASATETSAPVTAATAQLDPSTTSSAAA